MEAALLGYKKAQTNTPNSKLQVENQTTKLKQSINKWSGPSSSLVLDGRRGELVRTAAVRGGKRGGIMLDDEKSKSKAAIALRNHSEAERRRRERINSHLAVLRGMLTGTDKLDKASLLAQVINHVKLLQITAAQHAQLQAYAIPSHTDQVAVCCEPLTASTTSTTFLIRASICCDDSPQLYPQLKQSLQNLHERVVRAEISSLSGRVKIVLFIMREIGELADGVKRNTVVASIDQALRSALQRVNSCMEFMPRASNLLNKRRKILHFDSSSSSS